MGSGFSKMKKQARLMQEQMQKAQDELKNLKVTGEAGNGLVKATVNGECKIESISINPECVDPQDVEGLQDLLVAAFEDAYAKVDENSPMGDFSSSPLGSLPFGL